MLIMLFALFQCILLLLAVAWPWIHEPEPVLSTRIWYSLIALLFLGAPLGVMLFSGVSCDPFIWSLTATMYCFLTLYRISKRIDFEQDCIEALPPCAFGGDLCAFVDTLINALGACCFIMAASLCLCNCSSLSDMILYSGLWCYRIYYWLPRY